MNAISEIDLVTAHQNHRDYVRWTAAADEILRHLSEDQMTDYTRRYLQRGLAVALANVLHLEKALRIAPPPPVERHPTGTYHQSSYSMAMDPGR